MITVKLDRQSVTFDETKELEEDDNGMAFNPVTKIISHSVVDVCTCCGNGDEWCIEFDISKAIATGMVYLEIDGQLQDCAVWHFARLHRHQEP